MNRRNFLGSLIGGVAAGAAVRTWPFRVFSFPQEIVIPEARKFEYECDFVDGTAVRYESTLRNGVWIPRSSTTIKIGKVGWQRDRSGSLLLDREVLVVDRWDSESNKLIFRVPEGQKEPFIGSTPSDS